MPWKVKVYRLNIRLLKVLFLFTRISGGYLGLLAGISIVTFFELIFWIVKRILRICRIQDSRNRIDKDDDVEQKQIPERFKQCAPNLNVN